jgi:hypothetical protein
VSALTVPALCASLLLLLAGAQKVVDPTMTVGALRAMGLPAPPWLVRGGAALELGVGSTAIAVGGVVPWALVAASYSAFAVFVVVALRRGTAIGSCGCFGREDTPPHPIHVGLDLALACVAAAATTIDDALLDELSQAPLGGAVAGGLALLALHLTYTSFVALPRLLALARSVR